MAPRRASRRPLRLTTWFRRGTLAGMSEVSRLLSAIEQGDAHASGRLMPLVYDELRQLAAQKLAQERPGQTLEATALVHEAYLRLVGNNASAWDNRRHFFAAAAEAMRRILIEQARRKRRVRHGGGRERIELDEACSVVQPPSDDLLALDEALTRLTTLNPVRAEVVKLRFFAGLTMPEVAQSLGISVPTAERYWAFARTWLLAELTKQDPPSGE
jgi:RNA polymerase sigma factor (TIGR02999 family)